jgi:hypothetical protein
MLEFIDLRNNIETPLSPTTSLGRLETWCAYEEEEEEVGG